MHHIPDLHKDILLCCSDDEVGLWEVVWSVTRNLVNQQPGGGELFSKMAPRPWDAELGAQLAERKRAIDPNLVREEVLHVVRDLLEAGLIDAGFPGEHGTWESWNLSPAEAMRRIESEWDALGHLPSLGDIVWFVSTIEGDRVLAKDVERNTADES